MLIGDPFGMLGAFHETRDGIHRSRTVKGDNGADIFDALCPDAGAHSGHTGTFQLEHTAGMPVGKHLKSRGIVFGDLFNGEIRDPPAYHAGCIFQNREVAEAEKVHLEQAEFFQCGHRILADDRFIVLRKRNILHHRFFRDHDSGGMGGGMAGHALQRPGDIDQLTDAVIAFIHVPQRFGEAQSFVQCHVDGHGDLLRDHVGLCKCHGKHTPYIADRSAGGQRAESDDLGDMILPVDAVHIVDDFTPTVDAEVYVDIRHGNTFRVEKAFKEQTVFDRVNIGDVQAVGDNAPCSTSAPRTDRDALTFGVGNEVRNDEKIVHKPHLADHFQLVVQLGMDLRTGGKTFRESLLTEIPQIGVTVGIGSRQAEAGKMIVTEFKIETAHFGDLRGVVGSFSVFREEGTHLLFAFQIEFIRLKTKAVRLVVRLPGLDAHQDILVVGILLLNIMCIIGQNERDAGFFMKADQLRCDPVFLLDPVLLDLKIESVRTEKRLKLFGTLSGCGMISAQKSLGDLSGKTAGKTDETFGMTVQKIPVDPGAHVKTAGKSLTHEMTEVPVSGFIPAEKDQVGVIVVDPVLFRFH